VQHHQPFTNALFQLIPGLTTNKEPLSISTQTNSYCAASSTSMGIPFHNQDFYRNQFPFHHQRTHHCASSSTHTYYAHKAKETHISNREGKSHCVGWESTGREAIEEKERKMKRWRGIESICFRLKKRRNRAWVCCVFFTETKQIVLFGFYEKNTANPISVKIA